MENHSASQQDESSKTDVIVEHQENEKEISSTQSPVESVTPAAGHVTAKTWIVIFFPHIQQQMQLGLMPNKYRHIGIAISDGFVFFIVVVGSVVGRYATDVADNWRYIYYGVHSHKGCEFTVPFILAFIVTMFYYGINIIYPTMINVFYVTPTTSRSETLLLTLPGNLGLVFGAMLLICFSNLLGHWKLTLTASFVGMVFWGGLIALVTPYNKGLMIAFTFLEQTFFGWAQYESVAFTQLGVKQVDLGISGGLAGVGRYAGGSLAQAIYITILTNTQASKAAVTIPAAAIAAGLPASSGQQFLAAFSLGAEALAAVPGVTPEILTAASDAFKWSYAHGLQMVTYASLAFGGVAIICCILCENIDDKMNNNIEIYLENDVNADKNNAIRQNNAILVEYLRYFVIYYLNDIFVYSEREEDYERHVLKVLEALDKGTAKVRSNITIKYYRRTITPTPYRLSTSFATSSLSKYRSPLRDISSSLFKRDLLRGLLWKVEESKPGEIAWEVSPYRAPSWSWASIIGGTISDAGDCIHRVRDCHVDVIDVKIRPVGGIPWTINSNDNHYSEITAGTLTLRGRWTSCSRWPRFEEKYYDPMFTLIRDSEEGFGNMFRYLDCPLEEVYEARHKNGRMLSLLEIAAWVQNPNDFPIVYFLILESGDYGDETIFKRVGVVALHKVTADLDDHKRWSYFNGIYAISNFTYNYPRPCLSINNFEVMGAAPSKPGGGKGKSEHGLRGMFYNLDAFGNMINEGRQTLGLIGDAAATVKVSARYVALFAGLNPFIAASGVLVQCIQVYKNSQIIEQLQAINRQMAAQTALDTEAFATMVYNFIDLKASELRDSSKHWFFLYHPDNIWHPAFFSQVKNDPLPNNFFGLSDNLDALCLLMRYLRVVLRKISKRSGSRVVFHLLMPSYYSFNIPEPLAFADILKPLCLHGLTHQQRTLVALNLTGADLDTLDNVGVCLAGPTWIQKNIFRQKEPTPRLLGDASEEAEDEVVVTRDMRRVYRKKKHR
ncbi:hypothetical protein G7Y89_g4392 [Cudoniella acicularis]|uniref:Uncharacterized protein n=1 Tax=Cudoniella acicularis TaxID=354080 RepID=A0A8H4RPJ6_9HELO|nr:hypothetical protein G7Y89_g4392 [Cudoniella acicularis]